jgi:hypothetical protein
VADDAPAAAPLAPPVPAAPARTVQRAVQIDDVQVESSAPPQAAGGAAPSALQDPEQLREHVLRWVRAELLINRERAGRLSDIH